MREPIQPSNFTSPDGRWVIEVVDRGDGTFRGTVVLDGLFNIAAITTDSAQRMSTWVSNQTKEALRRQGEPPK